MAQTCWLFHSKCLIVRGVSNLASEPITDAGTLLAAKNAGEVTLKILKS
jgi:nucleoside phosphorylase